MSAIGGIGRGISFAWACYNLTSVNVAVVQRDLEAAPIKFCALNRQAGYKDKTLSTLSTFNAKQQFLEAVGFISFLQERTSLL